MAITTVMAYISQKNNIVTIQYCLENIHPMSSHGKSVIFILLSIPMLIFAMVVHASPIVISELMWSGSDLSSADEWIELTNTSSGSISLSGWTLTKLSKGEEVEMIKLGSGTLLPNKTFLISNYSEEKSRLGIDPDLVTTSLSLANTKMLIKLYNSSGTLIDTVDDGIGSPFAGLNTAPKASMERIDLSGSGQVKINWQTATTFINFDDDAELFGTPGAENGTGTLFTIKSIDTSGNSSSGVNLISTIFPNVRITEVLANPAGKDDEEWIEIGNLESETVDISGWILDDGNSKDHFEMPAGTILEPGEHKAFPKSITDLPLGNSGEEVSLKIGLDLIDSLTYTKTAEEVSYGIFGSGSNLQAFCVPTPNKNNLEIEPNPIITIQSGNLESSNKVTVNLIAEVQTGSTAHASCEWNYAENYKSDSCNPPSHTFATPGTYPIQLTYSDFCGNKIDRKVVAVVNDPNAISQLDVSTPAPPNSGGGGGSRSTSSVGGGGSNKTICRKTLYEGIRISEFVPNPEGDDKEGEWIELENILDQNVDLCGWFIDDENGGSNPYSLDAYRIAAKQFLTLRRSDTNITLNNTKDKVRLFAGHNDIIEEVIYEKSYDGKCYARNKEDKFEWTGVCTAGISNRFDSLEISEVDLEPEENEIKGNEGIKEIQENKKVEKQTFEDYSVAPIFSEILPNPNKGEEEYFELYNPYKDPIDLTGWILDDNPNGSSKPITLSGIVVMPSEYKAFYTKISLNNEGEDLSISYPNGEIAIATSYPKLKKGNSYVFDKNNNKWKTSYISTPGKRNIFRNGKLALSSKAKSKKIKTNKRRSDNYQVRKNPMDFIPTKYRIVIEDGNEESAEIPKLLSRILPQAHAKENLQEEVSKPLSDSKTAIFLCIFIPSLFTVSACRNRRNMI